MPMSPGTSPKPERQPFRVKFGRCPDGRIIPVEDANRDTRYECPACRSPLTLKSGQIRAKHFAHAANSNCSPETVQHKVAKTLLCEAVRAWREDDAPVPQLHRPKRTCWICLDTVPQALPETVLSARQEVPVAGGRVADVGLFGADGLLAVIEVLWSHAVDEDKQSQLEQAGIPWGEVDASDVLKDALHWRLVQDRFRPLREAECSRCRATIRNARARVEELLERDGVTLPDSRNYRVGVTRCSSCGGDMLFFRWPAGSPIPPRPKAVHLEMLPFDSPRPTRWANRCPCGGAEDGPEFEAHPNWDGGGCNCLQCILFRSLNDLPERLPGSSVDGWMSALVGPWPHLDPSDGGQDPVDEGEGR